jgi:hypothetical protein
VNVTEDGVPVEDVIQAVKQAIKTANVSVADRGRDLRVGSVRLTLHALATRATGGGLSLRIPFVGMEVQLGAKLTRRDTHEIEVNLTPAASEKRPELRDVNIEVALVEAMTHTLMLVLVPASGSDEAGSAYSGQPGPC